MAKSEQIIRENKQHDFEFEVEKGKYIERSAAVQTVIAALRKYLNFVESELEKNAPAERLEKLTALGCSKEIIAAFREFDVAQSAALIDRIREQCKKESA